MKMEKTWRENIQTTDDFDSPYGFSDGAIEFLDRVTDPAYGDRVTSRQIDRALRILRRRKKRILSQNWARFVEKYDPLQNGNLRWNHAFETTPAKGRAAKYPSTPEIADPADTSFAAGTPVKTPGGYKAIENIERGETVSSRNQKTGEESQRKVDKTFQHTTNEIYRIHYSEGTILEATGDHPIFIAKDRVAKVKDLHKGDRSLTQKDSESLGIRDIEKMELEGSVPVYNLEVEQDHTYFVTDKDVWVHNEDLNFCQYGSQCDFVTSMMNAFAGNEKASERATVYWGEIWDYLKESPLSPNFYGLRLVGFIGGGIPFFPKPLDISLKANMDSKQNVWVTMNIGLKTGGEKFGFIFKGTILKEGKFELDFDESEGLDLEGENFTVILRELRNYKEFEIGVSVGAGVGLELRWKPYTLFHNLEKMIEEKK